MSVRALFTEAELRKPFTRAQARKIKQSGLMRNVDVNTLRINLIKELLKQDKVADAVAFLTPAEREYYSQPPAAPAVRQAKKQKKK